MTGLTFGDLAQSYALRSRIGNLKSETVRLSTELSSGRKSDVAKSLEGELSGLAGLERSRALLRGYAAAGQEATLRNAAQQASLAVISSGLETITAAVGTLQQEDDGQISRVAEAARETFIAAFRVLNSTVAGRAIFAGMASKGPALTDPELVLTDLQGLLAGAETAEQIEIEITDWFDDPAGFEATAYLGAAPLPVLQIAQDGTSVEDHTATTRQIREALAALALAAFGDHPGLSPAGADRMDLRDRTFSRLSFGSDAVTDLAARIGAMQSRAENAIVRQQTEALSLELAVSGMVSADPARSAVELEAVRTNLETVYAVTARLSRLTLAEFLR